MNCNLQTAKGKQLLKSMSEAYQNVPQGLLKNVVEYANTPIILNPINKLPSSLLAECYDVTNDETQAAQMAACVYSPSFIQKYGDWLNGNNKGLQVDEEGMPKLFYQTSNGVAYNNYEDALRDQLIVKANELGMREYIPLIREFAKSLAFYSNPPKIGANQKLFNSGSSLYQLLSRIIRTGLLSKIDPIQIGYTAVTPQTIVDANGPRIGFQGQYNFMHVFTLNNFNYDNILTYFSSKQLDNVHTYNRYADKYKMAPAFFLANGHVQIQSDITVETLSRTRSTPASGIWQALAQKYPQYVLLYAQNVNRFHAFLQGVGARLLKGGEGGYEEIVDAAIHYETGLKHVYYQANVFTPSQQSVQFDTPPTPRRNEQYENKMLQLLAQTEDMTNLGSVLEAIGRVSTDRNDQGFARLLQDQIGGIEIEYRDDNWIVVDPITGKERYTDGQYYQNKIILSRKPYSDPYKLIIHEAMHAVTHAALLSSKFAPEANAVLEEARQLFYKKYSVDSIELLRMHNPKLAYYLSSTDEFFAKLWQDYDFIAELNSVGKESSKSFWEKLKDFFTKILGINRSSELYERADSLLHSILDENKAFTPEELADIRSKLPQELYEVRDFPVYDTYSPPTPNMDFQWNAQQSQAIEEITNIIAKEARGGERSICRIIGKAGTGKTSICPTIVQLAKEKTPYPIKTCIVAVANCAKNNLAQKFPKGVKVSAKSVAGLIGKRKTYDQEGNEIWVQEQKDMDNVIKFGKSLGLVIVDESSMLSEQVMQDIETICPYATIIYVGDKRQVRPVEKEYHPETPFVTRDVDYSIELLERVRQGEGAPILDIADTYGDVAGNLADDEFNAGNQLNATLEQASTEMTHITDTNAVISMHVDNNDIETVIDKLMPIIEQAIVEQNPNKIGIVPAYDKGGPATRTRFNNGIRQRLLKSRYGIDCSLDTKDELYVGNIPFQKGEILSLNDQYGNGLNALDNGLKLIVEDTGHPIEIPVFSHYVEPYNGQTIDFEFYETPVYYYDATGKKQHTKIKTVAAKQLGVYKIILEYLRQNAYQRDWANDRDGKNEAIKQFQIFSELNADVSPCWALNVHKAQGQTYEIAYVPVDDFRMFLKQSEDNKEPLKNRASQFSSQMYTAITRAANITILGSSTYQSTAEDVNFVELNDTIKQNKKTARDIVKEELEQPDPSDDATPEEDNPPTPELNVPAKFRKIYDFLRFITGNDNAFINMKTPQGKQYAQNLMQLFFQRESELVHFGRTFGKAKLVNGRYNFADVFKGNADILYTPITEDRLELLETQYGAFQKIDNLTIKSAQAVIPNQYAETFKMGNRSLSEITPDFFRHAPNYYWSKVENTDLLVRLHNGSLNIALVEDLKATEDYGKLVKITKDSLGYRLDPDGNRMYIVPKGALVYAKKDTAGQTHETIVLQDTKTCNQDVSTILKSLSENIVSVQAFLTNIKDIKLAKQLLKLSEYFTNFSIDSPNQVSLYSKLRSKKSELTLDQIKKQLIDYYEDERNAKMYAKKLANTLYNSFVKACTITSSRIPTQALASFMDMQVVAYNPQNTNDIFVSRWQMWLEGSDLDIKHNWCR